jgi:hypothetical protein
MASGSLPPSSPSCRRQKEKFAEIFGLQMKISSRPFFSPGRFVEKKGEKDLTILGSLCLNTNLKLEFVSNYVRKPSENRLQCFQACSKDLGCGLKKF